MEFLVTMTTRVPDSMPADAVERVRAREAARSRELAAQGKLLRLWRPPLRPGEWRTLGLFAADDNGELEQLLASMPPRSWRTDDVTPLGAHPNDPVGQGITIAPGKGPEFLIATTIMVRLWALPDGPDGQRTLGLWRARDPGELMAILESLPLAGWMTIETTPLSPHPDDPIRMP